MQKWDRCDLKYPRRNPLYSLRVQEQMSSPSRLRRRLSFPFISEEREGQEVRAIEGHGVYRWRNNTDMGQDVEPGENTCVCQMHSLYVLVCPLTFINDVVYDSYRINHPLQYICIICWCNNKRLWTDDCFMFITPSMDWEESDSSER